VTIEEEWVTGDLLEQDVQVIVNPWNRNFLPRWYYSGGVCPPRD
jgi:O-acetyl-ADP-ribose deacetylase (regulator of RNase III)